MMSIAVEHSGTTIIVSGAPTPTPNSSNRFTAAYEKTADGWWIATLLEIPGVFSQGKTLEEAREYLRDAAQMMLEEYRADAREELTAGAVEEDFFVPLP